MGSISFEDSGFCTETSSISLSNYIVEYTDIISSPVQADNWLIQANSWL